MVARLPEKLERQVIPLINEEFAKLRKDMQERDQKAQAEIGKLRGELERLEEEKVQTKLKLDRVREYVEKERLQ